MTTTSASSPAGMPLLAGLVLLHILLLWAWQHNRPARVADSATRRAFAWVWVAPRAAPPPSVRPRPEPEATSARRPGRAAPARPLPPLQPGEELLVIPPDEPAPSIPDDPFAEPAPTAAEMMDQARRSAGAIDQQLRREAPRGPERVRPRTQQERLAAAIRSAAVTARLGPVTVIELDTSSDTGGRIYRVTGPFGSFCMYGGPKASLPGATVLAWTRCPK